MGNASKFGISQVPFVGASVQRTAMLIEVALSHRTKEIRKLEFNGKEGELERNGNIIY